MQIPGKNPVFISVLIMLASIFTFSAASAYYDVQEDEWYYRLSHAFGERPYGRFPDGSFYPGMRITAAEFLKLICLSSWPEDVDRRMSGMTTGEQNAIKPRWIWVLKRH